MKFLIGGVLSFITACVCTGVAAVSFMYSGLYDVTAATPRTRVVAWAVHQVYQHSIKRNSAGIIVPADLEAAATVQNGAQLYSENCAMCHTAPGMPFTAVARGINPSAPILLAVKRKNHPNQMFWVIKNGVKMARAWALSEKPERTAEVADRLEFAAKDRGIIAQDYATLVAK